MAENVKVNYVYADAEEKYVKAVVLYAHEEVLYYDEAHEHAVNGADVLNFFLKGLIIVSPTDEYCVANTYYTQDGNVVVHYTLADEHYRVSAPIVTEE